jgi:hypothetical protein
MRMFFAIKIIEIRMTNVYLSTGYQTKSVEIPVPVKFWIRLARSKMGRKNPTNEYKIILRCLYKIIYGLGSLTRKRRAEMQRHVKSIQHPVEK